MDHLRGSPRHRTMWERPRYGGTVHSSRELDRRIIQLPQRRKAGPRSLRCGSLTFARSARLGPAGESWESLCPTSLYSLPYTFWSFASNHITWPDRALHESIKPDDESKQSTYLSLVWLSLLSRQILTTSILYHPSVLINCEKLNVNKALETTWRSPLTT